MVFVIKRGDLNVCTKAVWTAGVSELVNESGVKYVT